MTKATTTFKRNEQFDYITIRVNFADGTRANFTWSRYQEKIGGNALNNLSNKEGNDLIKLMSTRTAAPIDLVVWFEKAIPSCNSINDLIKVLSGMERPTNKISTVATLEPQKVEQPKPAPKTDANVIEILVDNNPKKPGSKAHERFAKYRNGMSVSEAFAAGITKEDVKHDVAKGFIRIA